MSEEIPFEFIKSILENFSELLNKSVSIEEQKKLFHIIIDKIKINELREIDSIKLKINDSLVDCLSNEGGVSIKGTPSLFMLKNVEFRYCYIMVDLTKSYISLNINMWYIAYY